MSQENGFKSKLVIDTDLGCDDFVALLTALGCGSFEVMGLTTIYGNAGVEQTTENALNLLKAIHHPHIPVYKGAKAPRNGLPLLAPVEVHGHNGIGNVVLPKSERKVEDMSAAEFLVEICNKFPGEVTLFFGGPLTNFADALKLDPDLPSKWASVAVMGGAFFVSGNIDNFREANFTGDPDGAAFVFSHASGIRVIGLDVTHQCSLMHQDIDELALVNANGALLKSIYSFYVDFYSRERKQCGGGAPPHDATGLMAIIDPELFEWKSGAIVIQTDDEHKGRSTIMDTPDEGHKHTVATAVNVESVLDYIKQSIKRSA